MELTCNFSGNIQPQSSQPAKPLWTYPGIKSGISLCKLISTLKKKERKKSAGGEWNSEHSPIILASENRATTTVRGWSWCLDLMSAHYGTVYLCYQWVALVTWGPLTIGQVICVCQGLDPPPGTVVWQTDFGVTMGQCVVSDRNLVCTVLIGHKTADEASQWVAWCLDLMQISHQLIY